jgi:hypothetical protein
MAGARFLLVPRIIECIAGISVESFFPAAK